MRARGLWTRKRKRFRPILFLALRLLQEGWWRLFRRDALAGQSFANAHEIEHATRVATAQLNRVFSYRL